MPIPSKPSLLPGAFAYNGTKNTIPDTTTTQGLASYAQGFPPITQMPLAAGGIPPQRDDFNGILHALSRHIVWQQSGGLYDWQATLNYPAGAHVLGSDGKEYAARQASGPEYTAGAKDPVKAANAAYWQGVPFIEDLPEPGAAKPKAPGSAAAGVSEKYAREDHVHPAPTSLNGNAATATKLAVARSIRTNLASAAAATFDGSANVTPGVSGILPLAHGGTGGATQEAAALALGVPLLTRSTDATLGTAPTTTPRIVIASSSANALAISKANAEAIVFFPATEEPEQPPEPTYPEGAIRADANGYVAIGNNLCTSNYYCYAFWKVYDADGKIVQSGEENYEDNNVPNIRIYAGPGGYGLVVNCECYPD